MRMRGSGGHPASRVQRVWGGVGEASDWGHGPHLEAFELNSLRGFKQAREWHNSVFQNFLWQSKIGRWQEWMEGFECFLYQ